jgi:hypothetical protein
MNYTGAHAICEGGHVGRPHVSFMSARIPDSSSSIPGRQSSAVMPLMKFSSSLTVGGWDKVSNRPVVDVLVAQYLDGRDRVRAYQLVCGRRFQQSTGSNLGEKGQSTGSNVCDSGGDGYG